MFKRKYLYLWGIQYKILISILSNSPWIQIWVKFTKKKHLKIFFPIGRTFSSIFLFTFYTKSSYRWGSDAGSCLLHIFCYQTPLQHLLFSQSLNFWSNRDLPWCSRSRKNRPWLKRKDQRKIANSWLSWFREEMHTFHGLQCHLNCSQCSPLFCILKKGTLFVFWRTRAQPLDYDTKNVWIKRKADAKQYLRWVS